jgi:hypothetical protein
MTVGSGLVKERMGNSGRAPAIWVRLHSPNEGICAKRVEGAGNQSSPDCRAREEGRSLHAVRLCSPPAIRAVMARLLGRKARVGDSDRQLVRCAGCARLV